MSHLVLNEEVFPALVKVLGIRDESILLLSLSLEMDKFPVITIKRHLNSNEAESLARHTGMVWPPPDDRQPRQAQPPQGGHIG
jgi:hypothetical protein